MEDDGSWPIVWERAKGVHVWDADGKKYLDLTGAFGVAAAGHANPRVVKAGQQQMAKLLHAMGDVHPHALKAQLASELSKITFERWTKKQRPTTAKTIFCNSGFEAVEAAFKTSVLATGKAGVIAFSGAYHGLGYGALNATHRDHFRTSFRSQLRRFTHFAPFPETENDLAETESVLRHYLRKTKIGGILVEPVQARGGINVPPPGFLALLRKLCDEHEALLILDEIYTGFGRTGKWFACEHSAVVPDLICLGKAMSGGFPISACVGSASVMDTAWPRSSGEAIHTSTFLGHPVGCAMALAQIAEIREQKLVEQSKLVGSRFIKLLRENFETATFRNLKCEVRGRGLMSGLELRLPDGKPATKISLRVIKEMLHAGYILLPEGEDANIISFTPPLIISEGQLKQTAKALHEHLQRV
ncbi:MAG: aspartate aminotransferase family protein [Verrucomicrobia bacterium]|nr:aspartate aminotransferase family protein [Verrucomicrobiota bacterium]